MKKLLLLLTAFALALGLSACDTTDPEPDPDPVTCETGFTLVEGECVADAVNTNPSITGVSDATLFIGNAFDQLDGITAADTEDGDLTTSIQVSGDLDLSQAGTYTLTYTVTDGDGGSASVTRSVVVEEADMVYPTGFYNYKFATTELRHTFMAAAEGFLMNTMYGGIPLYASGSFALYSARLQLPVEEYVAVMGYGTLLVVQTL